MEALVCLPCRIRMNVVSVCIDMSLWSIDVTKSGFYLIGQRDDDVHLLEYTHERQSRSLDGMYYN